MKEHPFSKLTAKIRPELNELEGNPFFQAFSEVGQLVFHLPISLITVIWLFRIWDLATLQENLLLIILLTIGMVITNNRTAIILIEIEPQKNVMATSSLGVIFLWTGLFILGPVFMWVNLAADTISAVIDARRLARLGQNAFWGPFANYIQGLLHILGALLGLSVYTAVDGQFPLSALEPVNWYPAILAIVISAIFSGTIILPGFSYLSKVMGVPVSLKANSHIILTVAISVLAQAPFAIPIALVYVYAGWTTFIFLLIGLILVNLLAYHLSESNQRSLRQSREMEQLEQLGEEIIRAAPDEIDLAEILVNHMHLMFSNAQDIFEIRLLDNAGIDLHIEQTTHKKMLPAEKLWNELWQSEEKYIILKDQKTPLNENIYGDAIMVKIISAASNANDGPPTCIGGIYLLRHKSFARTTDSLTTVEALESQIASALYRTQAYAETIASEKMSRELAIAGEIQASFLPDTVPDLDGWQIAASLTPARQTSGDFYDFIEFDDGRLGFLVADVADKGTGAALYMALSRTLIRTFALQYPEQPGEALRLANEVKYGLAGYVWTRDSGRGIRMARQLDVGMVWVNSENNRHLPSPFGGMKSSGIGRDGGDYSFDFYMETKNVCIADGTHTLPRLGM